MLLIIDNGSKYLQSLVKKLDLWGVSHIIHSSNSLKTIPAVKGIILSGGPGHPAQRTDLGSNYLILKKARVPILGICLGHEIIAHHYQTKVAALPRPQNKLQEITIQKNDFLFPKRKKLFLQERHDYHVASTPKNFKVLGSSKICPIEIMKHKVKPIYGFQGHPEISSDGTNILKNFVKLCGIHNN